MIQGEKWKVLVGNNLDLLPTLEDNSIDSIVTDPPYELGFMGKKWDSTGIAYNPDLWRECLRVLKPGGHLLSFGGTRTWHRIAVAIEDAGFEVRDSIAWMYGSGFPKSLDISKAIDKRNRGNRVVFLIEQMLAEGKTLNELGQAAGIPSLESSFRDWKEGGHNPEERSWERLLAGLGLSETDGLKIVSRRIVSLGGGNAYGFREGDKREWEIKETTPSTPEAQQWEGWGTALKPAFEPIIVARKPLIGTVAENVLTYGTGGLNIDGSRVKRKDGDNSVAGNRTATFGTQDTISGGDGSGGWEQNDAGRWPANVILDEYTAGLLDEQSGDVKGKVGVRQINQMKFTVAGDQTGKKYASQAGLGDSGGASRFFYVAKASKRDRNEGLEELEPQRHSDREKDDGVGGDNPRNRTNQAKQNFHPTVKPTELMRYLVKLVTPPDGLVLDPFTGSGSTGKAALLEGFSFLGMEMTEDYIPIIEGRLRHAETQVKENEGLF